MEKKKTRDSFLILYAVSMCIYAYCRADVLWLEWIPEALVSFIIGVVALIKILNGFGSKLSLIVIFFVYCMMNAFVWYKSYGSLVVTIGLFLAITSVIMLPISEKIYLLKCVTNCLLIILVISIPAWILYLIGVPLPHSDVINHPNGFHIYYDYYFFRVSAKGFSMFPRFSSVFLEPGQLATPCAFLWFLNGANFSRKNIVFLIGIALSFSLIAYGLVMAGFVVARFYNSKRYKYVKVLLSLGIIVGVFLFFSSDESSDDPVNALIFSRLEYDEEKGIVGNNRTTSYFNIMYDRFLNSSDKYFGMNDYFLTHDDWTYNCSGYKKFIIHRGLVGFVVFLSFIFLLFWYNRSISTFSFLVIILAAFFVRDLLQSPLWLSIAILGFYILNNEIKVKRLSQIEIKQ